MRSNANSRTTVKNRPRNWVLAVLSIGFLVGVLIVDAPELTAPLPRQVEDPRGDRPEDSAPAQPPPIRVAPQPTSEADLPDPDGVGPCPSDHDSTIVRRGFDSSKQPTWWHVDGSMTLLVRQSRISPDGETVFSDNIVRVTPAEAVPDNNR